MLDTLIERQTDVSTDISAIADLLGEDYPEKVTIIEVSSEQSKQGDPSYLMYLYKGMNGLLCFLVEEEAKKFSLKYSTVYDVDMRPQTPRGFSFPKVLFDEAREISRKKGGRVVFIVESASSSMSEWKVCWID